MISLHGNMAINILTYVFTYYILSKLAIHRCNVDFQLWFHNINSRYINQILIHEKGKKKFWQIKLWRQGK